MKEGENMIEINEQNFPCKILRNTLKQAFGKTTLTQDDLNTIQRVKIEKDELSNQISLEIIHTTKTTSLDGILSSEIVFDSDPLTTLQGMEHLKNIKSLHMKNIDGVQNMNLKCFQELEHVTLEKLNNVASVTLPNQIYSVHIAKCNNLRNIYDTEQATSLKTMTIKDCEGIERLDLTNNKELVALVFTDCHTIKELLLPNSPFLKSINCARTSLEHLNIDNNDLEVLDARFTKLKELDITNNPQLEYLYLAHTNIKELNLEHAINLRELMIDHTDITSLNLANTYKLITLHANGVKIDTLDISNCPKLNIQGNYNIKTTNIANDIEDIPQSSQTNPYVSTL